MISTPHGFLNYQCLERDLLHLQTKIKPLLILSPSPKIINLPKTLDTKIFWHFHAFVEDVCMLRGNPACCCHLKHTGNISFEDMNPSVAILHA